MEQLKRLSSFLMVLLTLGVLAGCASTRDTLGIAGRDDLAALQGEVTGLKAEVAKKAGKDEVAPVAQKVEHLTQKTSAMAVEMGAHGQRLGVAEKRIDGLGGELLKTNQAVANLGTSVQERFAALEKRVVGVRSLTSGSIARMGALEDSQGIDHSKKLLRLKGFPTAKYDEAKKEFTACAEISPAMKKLLGDIAALTKKDWALGDVVGFADERPFRGKDGKPLANSDELNSQCAKLRAESAAKELGLDLNAAVGRGTTTKFGGYDMNRSALVYLERSQAPAAAAPAPVPAPPAPAPAPSKKP